MNKAQRKRHIARLRAEWVKGYDRGVEDGCRHGREQGKEEERKAAQAQRNALHLNTLKEATALANTVGQVVHALVRGMESEKGQL